SGRRGSSSRLLLVEVSLQGIEAGTPQPAIWLDAGVDLGERRRAQLVPAPLRVLADLHEARLPQHAQVLRDPGLAEPERVDQLPHRPGSLPQEVQDAAPGRLGHYFEGGSHGRRITNWLYACQGIRDGRRRSGAVQVRRRTIRQ